MIHPPPDLLDHWTTLSPAQSARPAVAWAADAQLDQCCDALRTRFDGLGPSRRDGLAAWLRQECRPAPTPRRSPLRAELLQLLDGCDQDGHTAELRRRVERLPQKP
jgi:hypothetical protein